MSENIEASQTQASRGGNSYLIAGAIIAAGFFIALAIVSIGSGGEEPHNTAEAVKNREQKTATSDISDDDPFLGSPDAPVTIVEFGDFQCPFCKRFFETTEKEIIDTYVKTGKVKFVYRDFPIRSAHAMAQKSAEASECADEQNKFWEYHDLLYRRQEELSDENLKLWARDLKLNTAAFEECLDSGKYAAEVEGDYNDGVALGVNGTPANIINGKLVAGALPFSQFKTIIEAELKKQ